MLTGASQSAVSLAGRSKILSILSEVVDLRPAIEARLSRIDLVAYKPSHDYFWQFCPADKYERERKLYDEVYKEFYGGQVILLDGVKTRIGYLSNYLDDLCLAESVSRESNEDWLSQISSRERNYRVLIETNPRQAEVDRERVANETALRKREEQKFDAVATHSLKQLSARKLRVLAKCYFSQFGYSVLIDPADPCVLVRKEFDGHFDICIAVKDRSAISSGVAFGNFGLELIVRAFYLNSLIRVTKPILDIVDGFRAYSNCKDLADVTLAFYAYAEVFGTVCESLEKCLTTLFAYGPKKSF